MLIGVLFVCDNDDKCSNIMILKNNNKIFFILVKFECFSLFFICKRLVVLLKNNNFDNELDFSKYFFVCIY